MESKLLGRYENKKKSVGGIIHIEDIADEIDQAYKKYGQFDGLSTGIPRLDQILGGLRPGEITLIGGDPNNGKSALAANIAVNVAHNKKVLFITLEMLAPAIGTRMRHINGGTIEGLNMTFQKSTSINFTDLDQIFNEGVKDGGAELVVIDYLQYLGRGMTPDEVAKMSKLIKDLARAHEIPVIVIVSLRKDQQGKAGRRKWTDIEIDDFMGTGAIGYDADTAMIVSRRDEEGAWDNEHVYVRVIKIRSYPLDYDNNVAKLLWDRTRIIDGSKPVVNTTIDSVGEVPQNVLDIFYPKP
jgi:replicative DNA helicase